MATESTFQAYVARIPQESHNAISAVIVSRDLGYLSVQVFFHRAPIARLTVNFFKQLADQSRGAQIGTEVKTNDAGRAHLGVLVPTGNYICSVGRQEDAEITTVAASDVPFVIVLPVGRPYVDLGEDPEFAV